MAQSLPHRTWTRGLYLVSTDSSLVPVSDLNNAFATNLVYWADPLPEEVMRKTLDNSLCFGMYETKPTGEGFKDRSHDREGSGQGGPNDERKLIGFARCVTDFSTFSYLTDVYVLPSHQGEGLGKWIVQCVGEVHDSMPYLRRSMLFTSDWERSVPFYKKILGMELTKGDEGKKSGRPAIMQKLGPGFPDALR